MDDIKGKMDDSTKLVVMTAVNNVCGNVLPYFEVAELCKKRGVKLIIDGAQAGGHLPLYLTEGISAIALAGHKGLYGIMGSGALILNENFEVKPLIYGGTGTSSMDLMQPVDLPEGLESGTLALPAIAALSEGVRLVKTNLNHIVSVLENYTERLIVGLNEIENVKVYSQKNSAGIVAFSVKNKSSQEFCDSLNEYDIAVRGGYHCSPLTHKFLNTTADGLIRASLAPHNSSREIRFFINAVKELTR